MIVLQAFSLPSMGGKKKKRMRPAHSISSKWAKRLGLHTVDHWNVNAMKVGHIFSSFTAESPLLIMMPNAK